MILREQPREAEGRETLHTPDARSRRGNVHAPDEESVHLDTALIATLVRAGADIDALGALGLTPLQLALRNGRAPLANSLLGLGADATAGDTGRPIQLLVCDWATSNLFGIAPIKTLRGCIEAGADVNVRGPQGDTPLHTLMRLLKWNRPLVLAALTLFDSAGADLNARNEAGLTPLHLAMVAEDSAVVVHLLELGADPVPPEGSSTVTGAASCEQWPSHEFFVRATVEVVAGCIEAGAAVTATTYSPWSWWEPGPGLGGRHRGQQSALHVAAGSTSDPAVITVLTAAGAEVGALDSGNYTPLHYAALANGNPAVVAALVEAGADVNAVAQLGATPLHQAAAWNGNPAVLVELLRLGGDIRARRPGGRTALHEAAYGNANPEILRVLLTAGADVGVRGGNEIAADLEPLLVISSVPPISLNAWGGTHGISEFAGSRTPLHEAALSATNPAIVATLIEAGADIHARGDLDRDYERDAPPLYWAASANPETAVLELLVQAGADVNGRSGSGRTPLHIAALRNPVAFPKLLELGADPEAVDREGKTPMDYAVENLWLQGWEVVRRRVEERSP